MQSSPSLPYGVRSIIAGFGEPDTFQKQPAGNGRSTWIASWNTVGVAATWVEDNDGHTIFGSFNVCLDEQIWGGRKLIFTQIVDASRTWVGADA